MTDAGTCPVTYDALNELSPADAPRAGIPRRRMGVGLASTSRMRNSRGIGSAFTCSSACFSEETVNIPFNGGSRCRPRSTMRWPGKRLLRRFEEYSRRPALALTREHPDTGAAAPVSFIGNGAMQKGFITPGKWTCRARCGDPCHCSSCSLCRLWGWPYFWVACFCNALSGAASRVAGNFRAGAVGLGILATR